MEYITDREAEQRILSALVHSEASCIEVLSKVTDGDFADPMCRNLYLLGRGLFTRGVRPTFTEILKEGQDLGFIERPAVLEEIKYISQQYIDDHNINYWIGRVLNASKGRKAQHLIIQAAQELGKPDVDINQFIQDTGADFMALAVDTDTERIETGADIGDLLAASLDENIEKWRKNQDNAKTYGQIPLDGVPTGLPSLDYMTLGYKPGDLIILGAQTGHGKTAFAINTTNAVCVEAGEPMLYVNTEMSRKQIAYRFGGMLSEIELHKIRVGSVTNNERAQVLAARELLNGSKLNVAHLPNITPAKLLMFAQKAKLQKDIKLLILDYVGRLDVSDPRHQEWEMLSALIKNIKIMAQNLEIACMVLVQLNADGSLQGAKRMKNECDIMLQLLPFGEGKEGSDRKEQFQEKYGFVYEPGCNYYLRIDKNRDGKAGVSVPLVFDMDIQRIREAREVGKYVSRP